MKNRNALSSRTPRRNLPIASPLRSPSAFAASLRTAQAYADAVTPPPVPANIQVPAGNKAFLVGHAVGTQNYICLPAGVDAAGQPRLRLDALHAAGHALRRQSTRKSPPTTSAPTRSRRARPVCGWHDSRHVAALEGHEHRLGQGRARRSSTDSGFRRARCHRLAQDHGGWSRRRTDRRRHADADHLHPAAEHLWRGRTVDGLCLVERTSAIRHSSLTRPTTSSTRRPKATGTTTTSQAQAATSLCCYRRYREAMEYADQRSRA